MTALSDNHIALMGGLLHEYLKKRRRHRRIRVEKRRGEQFQKGRGQGIAKRREQHDGQAGARPGRTKAGHGYDRQCRRHQPGHGGAGNKQQDQGTDDQNPIQGLNLIRAGLY